MKKTNLIVESLYGKCGNLPVKEHLISEYDYDEYTDDVSDAYNRGEITAEEKHSEYKRLGKMLDEAYADVWWQYGWEERPEDLEKYGLKFKPLAKKPGMTLYRFLGSQDAIDQAKKDGYLNPKAGFIDESLTEARNPEHEKANKIIKKILYNKDYKLSDTDIEELKKFGLYPLKRGHYYDGSTVITGLNGISISNYDMYQSSSDFDYVRYLTKPRRDIDDIERVVYVDSSGGKDWELDPDENPKGKDDVKMSINQFNSLQPYETEKNAIKSASRDRETAQSNLRNSQSKINKAMMSAKSKHLSKKKNESLSLKESVYTAFPTFETAFEIALKDAVWHDITEAEAEEIVRKISKPVSGVVNDIFEMIKMLDERITELENK